jgi:hypothetical protein
MDTRGSRDVGFILDRVLYVPNLSSPNSFKCRPF